MSQPSNIITFNEGKQAIEERIKSNSGLTIVDFTAPWCPDCRRLAAGLPKVAAANPEIPFLIVDVDKVKDARDQWQIFHIPDVRFFKGTTESLGSIVEGTAAQVQAKIDELK